MHSNKYKTIRINLDALIFFTRYLACRETAFIHAITSAGVTYSLTESCAKGKLNDCRCRQNTVTMLPPPQTVASRNLTSQKQDLIYEGCHDNIQYGYERGKAFVDATETSHDFHAFVNLHNNEAGREVIIFISIYLLDYLQIYSKKSREN